MLLPIESAPFIHSLLLDMVSLSRFPVALHQPIRWLPRAVEAMAVLGLLWAVSGWFDVSSEDKGVSLPSSMETDALPDMALLVSTPLFGGSHAVSVEAPKPVVATPSRLQITLLGTVVAGSRSAAVLSMPGNSAQKVVRLGELIQSGVTLKGIEADAVTVDNHGRLERIEIRKDKLAMAAQVVRPAEHSLASAIRPVSAGAKQIAVDRNSLNQSLQDIPTLLAQARVVPHFSGGNADGFMITDIVANSLYQQAGLQNGDVIRKVNGTEIRGPQQAMLMYQQLQHAEVIDLEVGRAGVVQQLHYTIR